jgi:hypothetical protein
LTGQKFFAGSLVRELLLAAVAFGVCSASAAEPGPRSVERRAGATFRAQDAVPDGTLFRWWTAPDVAGGPDLEEPLVTDRPDFTEASVTVGRGVAQLETGYTFSQDDDGGVRRRGHAWGEALLRYGVWRDWFELRAGVSPLTETVRGPAVSESNFGLDDLYLGAKFALTPQAGPLPETALVPQCTLPTGCDAFSADTVLPGVNWIYSWDIADVVSVGGSTQVNRAVDERGGSYAEWTQSLEVGYGVTDRVGTYVEWFAFLPRASAVETEHYLDGGATLLLTDDVQWDVRAGAGLNAAAADFFVGTGLSVRFRPGRRPWAASPRRPS